MNAPTCPRCGRAKDVHRDYCCRPCQEGTGQHLVACALRQVAAGTYPMPSGTFVLGGVR